MDSQSEVQSPLSLSSPQFSRRRMPLIGYLVLCALTVVSIIRSQKDLLTNGMTGYGSTFSGLTTAVPPPSGVTPTTSHLIDSSGTCEAPTPWLIKHHVKDLHQEHTQKEKGKKLHHELMGRLGNQLFQWASTTGIAASNAMGTCFTGLQDIGVFFEVNPEDFKCTDAKPEKSIGEGAKYAIYNEFLIDEGIILFGYLQSFKYFDQHLRARLLFRSDVLEKASAFLSPFE